MSSQEGMVQKFGLGILEIGSAHKLIALRITWPLDLVRLRGDYGVLILGTLGDDIDGLV